MSEDDKQAPDPAEKKAEDAPAAPAPTIPLKPAGGAPSAPSVPAPAPTIPLKPASGGGAPAAPAAPAPTVQLKAPGASAAPKTTPLKTQPLAGDSDATQELPKATVQLGSATQALGAPTGLASGRPSLQTAGADEEEAPDKLSDILSVLAFVLALAVLTLQLMTTAKWVDKEDPVNHPSGWNALVE